MKGKRGACKQGKPCFDYMSMFTLSDPILLRRMWTRDTVNNTRALEVAIETMILTPPPPIGLNGLDFSIQKAFNISLESIKYLFNVRLVFKKINPSESRIIIYETNIVLVPPEDVRALPQTSE